MTEQGKYMYYIPHNPSFFNIHVLPYNTTFALILTSVSDVSTCTSIYLAVEFTFYFSAKSICKVMGMRCIRNKRLGAALTWFLRSKVSYKHLTLSMLIHCMSVGLSLILVILSFQDVGFATVLAEKYEFQNHLYPYSASR